MHQVICAIADDQLRLLGWRLDRKAAVEHQKHTTYVDASGKGGHTWQALPWQQTQVAVSTAGQNVTTACDEGQRTFAAIALRQVVINANKSNPCH